MMVNGMLWILRTGAPWRVLPERYGKWGSVYSRFRRWTLKGIWQHILSALQRMADTQGLLDWEKHYVDGTTVRAHQCAAGAVGGQAEQALGRSRGGFTTKIHLRAEGNGKPLVFVLSSGERHESRYLDWLIVLGKVKRSGPGRPRFRPKKLVGDKGYSYPSVRLKLQRRGITPVIPTKSNQEADDQFDRVLYRERNKVERAINRLKRFRRVATRYEKLACMYAGMVFLACILEWM
jgi:transposase